MISLLLSVASAIETPELADAEVHAVSVVSSCQANPRCGVDDLELAEAFVVKAAAAAVLRGEVDLESAANAMLLAPEVVQDWSHVLPAIDPKKASPWVRARSSDPGVERTAALEESEPVHVTSRAPRKPRARTNPGAGPVIARFGFGWRRTRLVADNPMSSVRGDLEVRASLARSLGMVGSVTLDQHSAGLVLEEGNASTRYTTSTRRIDLGVGPRWVGSHFDGSLYGGVVLSHNSATLPTYQRFADEGVSVAPAAMGWGGTLGAVGELLFTRWVGVYGHARLAVQKRTFTSRYQGPARDNTLFGAQGYADGDRDALAGDALQGLLVAELQLLPVDRFRFGLGVRLQTYHRVEARPPESTGTRNSDSEWTPRITTAVAF